MTGPNLIAQYGLKTAAQSSNHRRRIIVSSAGWQKCGKSDFILTAPKSKSRPLLVLDYDIGMDELLESERFKGQLNQIYRVDMRYPYALEPSGALTDETVNAAKLNVDRFKKLYAEGVRSGQFRTIGIDNGYMLLQAFRAARLGKAVSMFGGVDPKQYGPVNVEFEELLKLAYDHDTNVIITHRYEEKFGADKKTDAETGEMPKFQFKGYKDIKYVTQVHIEHTKDYKTRDLSIKILECRQNNRAEGQEFPISFLDEETCQMLDLPKGSSSGGTFLDVAMAVFPNSQTEEWVGE